MHRPPLIKPRQPRPCASIVFHKNSSSAMSDAALRWAWAPSWWEAWGLPFGGSGARADLRILDLQSNWLVSEC